MVGRPEKFVALRTFLTKKAHEFENSGEKYLRMTFKEIEGLGVALPLSAYKHRAWWSNNNYNRKIPFAPDPAEKVWERAHFKTKNVDMIQFRLTFEYVGGLSEAGRLRRQERQHAHAQRFKELQSQGKSGLEILRTMRSPSSPGLTDVARPYSSEKRENSPVSNKPRRHPIFGALKGTIRLVAGTDLTQPADPEWADIASGKDEK